MQELDLPEQKELGVETLTLSPSSCLGVPALPSAPHCRLGMAWMNCTEHGGRDTSAWPERGPGLRGHCRGKPCHKAPKEAGFGFGLGFFLLFFGFFFNCLAPLIGTKPADTDGVLQNRAKRQEHKEQSYL